MKHVQFYVKTLLYWRPSWKMAVILSFTWVIIIVQHIRIVNNIYWHQLPSYLKYVYNFMWKHYSLAAILEKLAAILDFRVANNFSLKYSLRRVLTPNLVLVSPFERFQLNLHLSAPLDTVVTKRSRHIIFNRNYW